MKPCLSCLALGLLLLASTFAYSAELEDLQQLLKGVGNDFKEATLVDQEINELRKELVKPIPAEEKSKLFGQYKARAADRIKKQDALTAKISKALMAAKGLPTGAPASLTEVFNSFEEQMTGYQGQLDLLQAQAMALSKKDGNAASLGRLATENLNALRRAITTVREASQKVLEGKNGQATTGQLVEILEAMQIAALTRETALGFEFAMTAQYAALHDYMSEVSGLFKELMQGKDFSRFMADSSRGDAQAATYMVRMTQMMVNSSLNIPVITEMEMDSTLKEIAANEKLMPYDIRDTYYYYDFDRDRWYVVDAEGNEIYLPTDEDAGTGRYVRMHADGFIYSEAPWLDKPKQLTFSKDWQKETAEKPAESVPAPAAPAAQPDPAKTNL